MRPSLPWFGLALVLLTLLAYPARAELRVTELTPLLGGDDAGLQPGDRLIEWQHELGSGRLDNPLTLQALEIEFMPLGPVTLIGDRSGDTARWILPALSWGISTETGEEPPASSGQRAWEHLTVARAEVQDGDFEAAEARFALALSEDHEPAVLRLDWSIALESSQRRASARDAVEQGLTELRDSGQDRPLLEAQLLERIGVLARRLSDLDAAESQLHEALEIRRQHAPGSPPEAESLYDLHLCAFMRGQLDLAAEQGAQSLAIYEALPASEYTIAQIRNMIGRVSLTQGDHDTAREHFEWALAVFVRVDPKGTEVGECYTNLGILARRSGELALAEERFLYALAIYEAHQPNGGAVAMLLNNLGAVTSDRGDLFAAEQYVGRALAMRESREPNSLAVAMYLNNVASLAFERGDLVKAERLYLRALDIRKELAPESLDTALSHENLGSVCYERGELLRSEQYFERSLVMIREIAPNSGDEARLLSNMGLLALRQGDAETGLERYQKSWAIRDELSPGGIDCAKSLSGMADANRQLGQYIAARQQLEEAVAICQEIAPGGLSMASYCGMLSTLYLETDDPEAALEYAERSLELRQKLVGGSYWEAISWHGLGKVHRSAGRWELALTAFAAATMLMDGQGPRVGEVESSRISFGARHADMYRDCIDARVQLGDLEGAVEDLERSRARSFLAMLGQRDLQFTADLPEELLAERRRNRTEYDRAVSELAGLSPLDDPETAERLSLRLADLSEERTRIAAEVRRLSPQLDAIESPQRLSSTEILESIPQDMVLISYSAGPNRLHGFVLRGAESGGSGEISVFTQELGREELQSRIRQFRESLQNKESYAADAQALYRLLVEPATDSIEDADRLLISPDGPIHLLPFAALLIPDGEQAGRFLVEWRPLHFTSSVAVYGALDQPASMASLGAGVIFADPGEFGREADQFALRSATYRSLAGGAHELGPLESAREEASAIESLYGASRTTVYLGSDASEAQAKQLSGKLTFVHFACHAFADENQPLDSALILGEASSAVLSDENGFLQSWEILESVRFDADLVTLSACETALGVDMGGEGLLGLVRSFQYAGASAVLASLWQVADRPTARLMEDFYRALSEGRSKDEALRSAQLRGLSQPVEIADGSPERGVGGLSEGASNTAHPFYWAAFQIYGNPSPGR